MRTKSPMILRPCIKATAEQLSQKQVKVTQGDLVACVSKRNPAKASPHALMNLCPFYIGFLDNGVVDVVTDLVEIHSHTVDPREITASTSFVQSLVSEEALPKCPQTRLFLVMSLHHGENPSSSWWTLCGPNIGDITDHGPLQEA